MTPKMNDAFQSEVSVARSPTNEVNCVFYSDYSNKPCFYTSVCQGVTDCLYCQWASCGSTVCDVCGHIPAGLQHQQQGGRRPGRQQRHAQGQGAADARRGARWQFQGDAITRRQAAGEKHSQNIHFSLN